MAYNTTDARRQLLEDVAGATDGLGAALAALGDAYEALDERTADRLEAELFAPVQAAYGRARRTHDAFAARHGLPARAFAPAAAGLPSTGVRGFIDNAVVAVQAADAAIAELQDSLRPVDVGDAELRAGLAEVRRTVAPVPGRARELVRVIGR